MGQERDNIYRRYHSKKGFFFPFHVTMDLAACVWETTRASTKTTRRAEENGTKKCQEISAALSNLVRENSALDPDINRT